MQKKIQWQHESYMIIHDYVDKQSITDVFHATVVMGVASNYHMKYGTNHLWFKLLTVFISCQSLN